MAQQRQNGGLFASLGAVLMTLLVGAVVAAMVSFGRGIGSPLRTSPRHAVAASHVPIGAG